MWGRRLGRLCSRSVLWPPTGLPRPGETAREDITTAALDPDSPPETCPFPLKLMNLSLSTLTFFLPALPIICPGGSLIGRNPGSGTELKVGSGVRRELGRAEPEFWSHRPGFVTHFSIATHASSGQVPQSIPILVSSNPETEDDNWPPGCFNS